MTALTGGTAQQLIIDSLLSLGAVSPGEIPTVNELNDCLRFLNRLIDSWNSDRLYVYTISVATFDLVAGQMTYTIGGKPPGDFDADRPVKIESANIIYPSTGTALRYPLRLVEDDEWASIRLQSIPSTIPTVLYNDGGFPRSTLYLWGQPAASQQLELYTWQQLSQITILGTTISLPPGYERALMYNLAVEIAPMFDGDISRVALQAAESKAAIQSQNVASPKLIPDQAACGTGVRAGFSRAQFLSGGMS